MRFETLQLALQVLDIFNQLSAVHTVPCLQFVVDDEDELSSFESVLPRDIRSPGVRSPEVKGLGLVTNWLDSKSNLLPPSLGDLPF